MEGGREGMEEGRVVLSSVTFYRMTVTVIIVLCCVELVWK